MIKDNILNLSSLNCNSLRKITNTSARDSLIRYLRQHPSSPHIITLQETNAIDHDTTTTFNMLFRSQQSLWSHHCGIVSLDSDLSFQRISIDLNNSDFNKRFIFTKVSSHNQTFASFFLLTLYAPASSTTQRRLFYTALLDSPIFTSIDPHYTDRLIITGDFNFNVYQQQSTRDRISHRWVSQLQLNFVDCITDTSSSLSLPTYRTGVSFHSTLDFIFASRSFHSFILHGDVEFVSRTWTDHALLSARIQLGSPSTGKGYWRGNPNFSYIPEFRQELVMMLNNLWPTLDTIDSLQQRWEHLKSALRRFTQQFGRQRTQWRQQQLKALMSKRNRLLRSKPPPNVLAQFLPRVEQQISNLQQETVDILALKARQRWREKGEKAAGYLKKNATQAKSSRMITSFVHPSTGATCSEINDLHDAATTFYQELYTPTTIDDHALDALLVSSTLPCLSSSWQNDLMMDFTIDDLQDGAKRAPKQSSPGPDGLPYSTWFLVFKHPSYHSLACAVFNMALQQGIYPSSWKDTCVTLLPKKGDLQSLRNWRPISLINTDAKIFTRLLNARLVQAAGSLINPFQTGFMPDRFIADNGMLAKLAMEQANGHDSSSSIALLLDQEKAYDRIHPSYLRQVLSKFGIPDDFINAVNNLFFSTRIRININGHLSPAFTQQRGLRQGDPISPILFNLAIEPLLRAIMDDDSFQGVQLNTAPQDSMPLPSLPALKCQAYADDIMVFLSNPQDLARLQLHLNRYQLSSNAKLNAHKSQAISLSGQPQPEWNQTLEQAGFPTCHDRTWSSAVVYLGYPLASSKRQLDVYLDKLLSSVRSLCHDFSDRQLSVRGRATILNMLILSTIWHTLRLVGAPSSFFRSLRACMGGFLMHKMFPRVSLQKLCQPLEFGGLGILDPEKQQGALQLRWLDPLFHPSSDWNYTTLALAHHLRHAHPSMPDHRFPLLLSSCRKSIGEVTNSVSSLFFKAMDLMSLDISSLSFDVSVVLQLPLNCIWYDSPGHKLKQSRFRHLKVHDIFYLNPSAGFILWRPMTRIPLQTRHKCLAKSLLHAVSQQHIHFHHFFQRFFSAEPYPSSSILSPTRMDASPITSFMDAYFDLKSWTTRRYRSICQPSTPLIPSIPRKTWKIFWSSPMEHSARNVWYRIIHNTIPTATRLAHYGIHHSDSLHCQLCHVADDTLDHFLVLCPHRRLIWMNLWDDQFHGPYHAASLLRFLKHLTCSRSTVSFSKLLAITSCYLLAMWQLYWLKVFNNQHFHHVHVITRAQRLLARFSLSA